MQISFIACDAMLQDTHLKKLKFIRIHHITSFEILLQR